MTTGKTWGQIPFLVSYQLPDLGLLTNLYINFFTVKRKQYLLLRF